MNIKNWFILGKRGAYNEINIPPLIFSTKLNWKRFFHIYLHKKVLLYMLTTFLNSVRFFSHLDILVAFKLEGKISVLSYVNSN